jgi:hypothetical protein
MTEMERLRRKHLDQGAANCYIFDRIIFLIFLIPDSSRL